MGRLQVKWLKSAFVRYEMQAAWYRNNCGRSFEVSFRQSILSTIELLSESPMIGTTAPGRAQRNYRTFPAHPKCRIVYRYTSRTLYIENLRFLRMNG